MYDDQHAGIVRLEIQLTIDGLPAAQNPGVGSLSHAVRRNLEVTYG